MTRYAGFTNGANLVNGGTTWHDIGPTVSRLPAA
jgi:hypothetical protein